jgi:hypothetical protein
MDFIADLLSISAFWLNARRLYKLARRLYRLVR